MKMIVKKIKQRFEFFSKVKLSSYIYYNYFCKAVIRMDKYKLIPYKSAIIELEPGAKIFLKDGDIEIGCDKLKKSKSETLVRLRKDSVWGATGGCKISYGATIELLPSAVVDSKYFTMNSNSVMVIAKKISLGQDVMIGRNVVIYDSDFHSLLTVNKEIKNFPEEVVIGDHVWIGTNALLLKGTRIGQNSIIGAQTLIKENISANTSVWNDRHILRKCNYGSWERKSPIIMKNR